MATARNNRPKALSFCIRYSGEIQSSSGQLLKPINLLTQNLTTGISSGAVVLVNLIYTKGSMSSRKSIIFHKAMRSPEKIDCASIFRECKRLMGLPNGISCLRRMSFQTSMVTLFKDLRSLIKIRMRKKIYGLLNHRIYHVVEVYILLMMYLK